MRALLLMGALWCGVRAERERLAGRYPAAAQHCVRGLYLLRRSGQFQRTVSIGLLNTLGMVHKYEAHFAQAARAYAIAVRLAQRHLHPEHLFFATLDHNLAGLEHARGNYVEAEPLARRGLDLRERVLGPRHPDVARDVAALAAILDGQSRHHEAEELHRRALAIFSSRRRTERREVGYVLANLAACLHLAGRSDEAEPLARKALDCQIHALGPRHPDVFSSQGNLAMIDAYLTKQR